MEKKMNNKGFSLVELIVVIAIMAVLVGVLAPQFMRYVEKSRQSTDITNLDNLKQVVETYYADQATLPTTVEIKEDGGVLKCMVDSADKSDPVFKQGGVENTKLKGNWGTKPSATWTPATNAWTYNGLSSYYKVDNNQFVPE